MKAWRKAKGLTQEELAAAVGIGPAYMSNLERDILLKRGANPYHIKDLFAHSDLETSSIYISSQMDDLRDTVRLLDVPEVGGVQ